jgi:hypothetical protein
VRFTKDNKGHYAGTAQHVERHETPDSSRPADGQLSDDPGDRGPILNRPMDEVTRRHTYTSGSGSKRDD